MVDYIGNDDVSNSSDDDMNESYDVGGRIFRIGELLGKGSVSKCYKFTEEKSGKHFACKRMSRNEYDEIAANEVKILEGLKHDHVVQFVEAFKDTNHVYIIFELCTKETLMDYVERIKKIPEDKARAIFHQILLGCQYLHEKGIIHHDLKPNNVFMDAQYEDVKIGDFGLATKGIKQLNRKMGTPNYLAPEIINDKVHTVKVDIWALGCILYFMLVGKAPFEENTEDETYKRIKNNDLRIPKFVSKDASSLIASMLSSSPAKRPQVSVLLATPFITKGFGTVNCYEVEKIIGKRRTASGKTEYKIKWKNYGESYNSWEPQASCKECPDLIDEFEQNANEKSKINSGQKNDAKLRKRMNEDSSGDHKKSKQR